MFHSLKRLPALLAALCALASAAAAGGQPVLIPFKYSQPYTWPWASHASVVRDCSGAPVTYAPVAMDDWLCTQTGNIPRVLWWGTCDPGVPPQRWFHIRVWSHSGIPNCRPQLLLYQRCVFANIRYWTTDCTGRQVFRYWAWTPGLTQTAGTRYWLQISETDLPDAAGVGGSPRPGVVDFRWSAHRQFKNCPALQLTAAGVFITPLIDPCDGNIDDLAFRLSSRYITGVATPAQTGPLVLTLHDPTNNALIESVCILPDEGGVIEAEPESPDGTYRLRLSGGPGVDQDLGIYTLSNNNVLDLGMVMRRNGDVNGDNKINFGDVSILLGNWLP